MTAPLRNVPVSCAFGHCGPWLEDFWIDSFLHAPLSTFGGAIPLFVQWLSLHPVMIEANHGQWRRRWGVAPPPQPNLDHALALLSSHLHPKYTYVTVAEHDFGVGPAVRRAFPNLFVLGCSEGDVILPLLKQPLRPLELPNASQQPYHVGFAGTVYPGLRADVVKALVHGGIPHDVFRSGGWPTRLGALSRLGLAPRGVGRGSFRLTELVELGIPPVYVWDDAEWLPYSSVTKHAAVSFRWDSTRPRMSGEMLIRLLRRITSRDVMQYRLVLRALRPHFSPCGVISQISCLLSGQPTDIACATNSGVLSGRHSGEGIPCKQRLKSAVRNDRIVIDAEVLGCEPASQLVFPPTALEDAGRVQTCRQPTCGSILNGSLLLRHIAPRLRHVVLTAPVTTVPADFVRGLSLQSLRLECGWTPRNPLASGALLALPPTLLLDQPELLHFYAGHNQLRELPSNFFDGAPALQYVHLAVNQLQSVPVNLLEPLTQLSSFYIGGFDDAVLTRPGNGSSGSAEVAQFLSPILRRCQPISIGLPKWWFHAEWMLTECRWGMHFEHFLGKSWVRCYMCFGQTNDSICRLNVQPPPRRPYRLRVPYRPLSSRKQPLQCPSPVADFRRYPLSTPYPLTLRGIGSGAPHLLPNYPLVGETRRPARTDTRMLLCLTVRN